MPWSQWGPNMTQDGIVGILMGAMWGGSREGNIKRIQELLIYNACRTACLAIECKPSFERGLVYCSRTEHRRDVSRECLELQHSCILRFVDKWQAQVPCLCIQTFHSAHSKCPCRKTYGKIVDRINNRKNSLGCRGIDKESIVEPLTNKTIIKPKHYQTILKSSDNGVSQSGLLSHLVF
jgi:hypothetical protein